MPSKRSFAENEPEITVLSQGITTNRISLLDCDFDEKKAHFVAFAPGCNLLFPTVTSGFLLSLVFELLYVGDKSRAPLQEQHNEESQPRMEEAKRYVKEWALEKNRYQSMFFLDSKARFSKSKELLWSTLTSRNQIMATFLKEALGDDHFLFLVVVKRHCTHCCSLDWIADYMVRNGRDCNDTQVTLDFLPVWDEGNDSEIVMS